MHENNAHGTRDMQDGKFLKRANPGTIQDKFPHAWSLRFTCGNDGPPIGEGHHGWLNCVDGPLAPPSNGRLNTDLWLRHIKDRGSACEHNIIIFFSDPVHIPRIFLGRCKHTLCTDGIG
ncbi:hypothetical protein B0H14DRAFT_3673005 [Mycena olivaceomarginata]|nr:hypothetical protein B0H14DRAFT_3673005 [Mycena olivaceomarginata]